MIIYQSITVNFSNKQMYDLVNNITSYPEFIEHCKKSQVHWQTNEFAEVTLYIVRGFLKFKLLTHNYMIKNKSIIINLIEGPLKNLTCIWKFIPLNSFTSKVNLVFDFDFNNSKAAFSIKVIFDRFLNQILSNFCCHLIFIGKKILLSSE